MVETISVDSGLLPRLFRASRGRGSLGKEPADASRPGENQPGESVSRNRRGWSLLLSGLGFVLAGGTLGSLLFGGWEVCVLAGKAGAAAHHRLPRWERGTGLRLT